MADKITDAIQEMIDGGQLPEHVSNKLIFATIVEVLAAVVRIQDMQTLMEERIDRNAKAIEDLIKLHKESPSLTWLLKYRTGKTLTLLLTIAAVIITISIALVKYPQLQTLFGVAVP